MNTMQVILVLVALTGTGFLVTFLHALAVERHNHRLVTPLVAVAAGIAVWLVYFGLSGLQSGSGASSSSWALLAAGVALYVAVVARATVRTSPAVGAAAALAFAAVGIAAGVGGVLLAILLLVRGLLRTGAATQEEAAHVMQLHHRHAVRDSAMGR